MINQAVILVGGLGTRLRSLGLNCPKPMAEIGGRPFVEHVIRHLARFGIKKIVLVAGYKGDLIRDRYDGCALFGASIEVVIEASPMGTGGALGVVFDLLEPQFVVSNGDSLFNADLSEFLVAPLGSDAAGRLLLREVADASRYGTVCLGSDGGVKYFREKQEGSGRELINAGVYLLRRDHLKEYLGRGPMSIEMDIFPYLAAQGRLEGIRSEGYFIDIGLPDTYEQAGKELITAISAPAAFLDRDGVINVDGGYTHRIEDLRFTPTSISAIRSLNAARYYVIVVTNQAGIAKGHYTEFAMHLFHGEMQARLMSAGAHVDAFYYCPYHPEGTVPGYIMDHPDRKPLPGMIERAFSDWPISRNGSFLVGDRYTDLEAATAAGIPGLMMAADTGDLDTIVRKQLSQRRFD